MRVEGAGQYHVVQPVAVEPIKRVGAVDEKKVAEIRKEQADNVQHQVKTPEPKRDPERILSERA